MATYKKVIVFGGQDFITNVMFCQDSLPQIAGQITPARNNEYHKYCLHLVRENYLCSLDLGPARLMKDIGFRIPSGQCCTNNGNYGRCTEETPSRRNPPSLKTAGRKKPPFIVCIRGRNPLARWAEVVLLGQSQRLASVGSVTNGVHRNAMLLLPLI
ncbi:hypothetical protein DPMN_065343 [Dreissena polymorpha]|uniref:Uncharacterized protein n=1 Tax=Dreissena polymorpha TaxID=45954 RepID=A0A9D4CF74_DREPO|nr:hypothetical protein DPMN_065343 [Dreissena polymorpha]